MLNNVGKESGGWFKNIFRWGSDEKKPVRPKYPSMPMDEGADVYGYDRVAPPPQPSAEKKASSQTPAATTEKPAQNAASSPSTVNTVHYTPGPKYTPQSTYTPYTPPPPKPAKKGPIIGILVESKQGDDGFEDKSSFWKPVYMTGGLIGNYRDAVNGSGGVHKWIYPDGGPLSEQLRGTHGLLIPGGGDINPDLYDQKSDGSMNCTSKRFDNFEKAAYLSAKDLHLPIRGICRGLQMINVAEKGGTLIQDINDYLRRPYNYRVGHRANDHTIVVVPKSRFGQIMKEEILHAPSNHHQAIGVLAPGFIPVASSADQIIEAIENVPDPNGAPCSDIVAVQFHPERSSEVIKKRFFDDFISHAETYWKAHPNVRTVIRVENPPPAEVETASAPPPAASVSKGITVPADSNVAMGDGLEALAASNIEVAAGYISDAMDRNQLLSKLPNPNYDRFQVRYKGHSKVDSQDIVEVSKGRLRELLLSATPQGMAFLPAEKQRGLELVARCKDAGMTFYRKKMLMGKEQLALNIQPLWVMADGKLVASFKSPVSGEMMEERIHTEDQLTSVLGQLRQDQERVYGPKTAAAPAASQTAPAATAQEQPAAEEAQESAPPEAEPAAAETSTAAENPYKDVYKRFVKPPTTATK